MNKTTAENKLYEAIRHTYGYGADADELVDYVIKLVANYEK